MSGSRQGLVLGIDLGYSGARAAVTDGDARLVAAGDRFPVPTRAAFGRAEQDPADWLSAVESATCSALRDIDVGRIEAIGVSALGPAPVLVADDLSPLTPALLFSLDTRAEDQRQRLAAALGLSDGQLNHDHAIPKLLWWREQDDERWDRAAWALDATGFVVAHMTGQPTMDTITAHDYELEGFSCPVPVPQPLDPLSIAGPLKAAWAKRLGLLPGVPVITGTFDAYADTAATGTLQSGDACIIFGSTLIIGVVHDAVPSELHGLVAASHLGEGVLIGGWTATGGSALGWAQRLVGAEQAFDEALDVRARQIEPGAGGLVFLPYLTGERSPVHDPAARGVLLGLTVETKREDVYRAVLDGVALSVRDHAERLALLGPRPRSWRAAGGGSRARALLQATCDSLRAPLELMTDAAAPVGPCRLALGGLGLFPPVVVAEVIEPSAHSADRFDVLYEAYRSIYPALSREMHLLTDLNRPSGGGRGNDARGSSARCA